MIYYNRNLKNIKIIAELTKLIVILKILFKEMLHFKKLCPTFNT
jgi:hypothetical protein